MTDTTFRTVIISTVCLALCAIFVVLHFAFRQAAAARRPAAAPALAPAAPPVAAREPAQRIATLHNGNPSVDVAVDEQALFDLVNAARLQNAKRYYAVFDSGRAFRVGDGTRVRIVGAGYDSGCVQILSGASTGRTGYVPQEWIDMP